MPNDIILPIASQGVVGATGTFSGGGVMDASWYRPLTTLADQHNTNTRNIATAQTDITTAQGNITTLQSNTTTLQSQVAALQVAPAYANAAYTTNAALSTVIPLDDTIPQITEGTQILSLSIAASKSNSLILVTFAGTGGVASGSTLIAALFLDGAVNAVQVVSNRPSTTNISNPLVMQYTFAPGNTSSHTLAVRVGANSGDAFMNGGGTASRQFGGAEASTLTAEEILQ